MPPEPMTLVGGVTVEELRATAMILARITQDLQITSGVYQEVRGAARTLALMALEAEARQHG